MEQIHWLPLCQRTGLAPVAFAGYHLLVLVSIVGPGWMLLAFIGLIAVSIFWRWLYQTTGNLSAPLLSHALADLGIVLAAWLRS
jgi:membrane protease YdiL (CAAX protease family)